MTEPVLRVMQSFRAPRPTTNPYITMLDAALAAEPTIDHLRFSWADAIRGRVDVLHFHWPETLLEGDAGWKRAGKRMLMRLLLARARRSDIAIVRTVHNLELPQGVPTPTRRLLEKIESRTVHRIVLNPMSVVAGATTLIPHGHYRDWFAHMPQAPAVPGRLGYFGLIRRYKGVDALLDAYRQAAAASPDLSLRIGGRPSSTELETSIREAAAADPSITTTLRFLEDEELVDIATTSQVVVLPYRFMHNSGSALAALSVDRPILVPRNEVNALLAEEVGAQWVHTFDGDVDGSDLRAAIDAPVPDGRPDLSRRDWTQAGRAHADAYRRAATDARGRA